MIKKLRRRCIIREYDFNNIIMKKDPNRLLYDSYQFEPFTKLKLEQESMWHTLKDIQSPAQWLIENPPRSNIRRLQEYLYDKRYVEWATWYDHNGFVIIQARKNAPQTRLGWFTAIKDLSRD